MPALFGSDLLFSTLQQQINVDGHKRKGIETNVEFVSIPHKALAMHFVVQRDREGFSLVVFTRDACYKAPLPKNQGARALWV